MTWRSPDDAPCTAADPDLFSPERVTPELILKASVPYCRRCSDRPGCLDEGIRLEASGIWGGFGLVGGKLSRQPSANAVAAYERKLLREGLA